MPERASLPSDGFSEAVWRDLLPPGVCFSAGFEPSADDLTPCEEACLLGDGNRRRREFAAGRWHARRALRALGSVDASLPRGGDGAPVWPEGFTGTLSHTMAGGRVYAVAAAVRDRDSLAIGIDVEAPSRLPARVWETALTRAELARVMAMPVPKRPSAVMAYWCAKEAASKAWRGFFGIGSIAIFREPHSSAFEARSHATDEARTSSVMCTGKIVQHEGWTFAVALRVDPVALAARFVACAAG